MKGNLFSCQWAMACLLVKQESTTRTLAEFYARYVHLEHHEQMGRAFISSVLKIAQELES